MGCDGKLWNYLLGFKFNMYTDNNLLANVREGSLGVVQIRWLFKLVLFDFDIKCGTDRSNKAADAFRCHPYVPEEMDSDSESDEYETILYTMVCEELEEIIYGEKLPIECKMAVQNKNNKPAQQELELHSSVIEVLSNLSPSEMKETQEADPTIYQVVQRIKAGNKPQLCQIGKEKSKNVKKYLHQFDHLEFRKGVLY